MNADDKVSREIAMADACAIASLCLEWPSEPLLEGIGSGALAADIGSIAAELGDSDLWEEALAYLRQASGEATLPALRREHTRLFDHPLSPAVPQYEGQFRHMLGGGPLAERPRLFVNSAAKDAEHRYRAAGFDLARGRNIPADGMATELQFIQLLHAKSAQALLDDDTEAYELAQAQLEEFAGLRLRGWAGDFFLKCSEESRLSFYRFAGLFGAKLLELILPCGDAANKRSVPAAE